MIAGLPMRPFACGLEIPYLDQLTHSLSALLRIDPRSASRPLKKSSRRASPLWSSAANGRELEGETHFLCRVLKLIFQQSELATHSQHPADGPEPCRHLSFLPARRFRAIV